MRVTNFYKNNLIFNLDPDADSNLELDIHLDHNQKQIIIQKNTDLKKKKSWNAWEIFMRPIPSLEKDEKIPSKNNENWLILKAL